LANRKLDKAVLAPPRCNWPVGLGANLTRGFIKRWCLVSIAGLKLLFVLKAKKHLEDAFLKISYQS
jgi:hypothetical protein